MSVSAVLTLIAVVLFVLAAFGVSPFAAVALVPLALAFGFAAFLV